MFELKCVYCIGLLTEKGGGGWGREKGKGGGGGGIFYPWIFIIQFYKGKKLSGQMKQNNGKSFTLFIEV